MKRYMVVTPLRLDPGAKDKKVGSIVTMDPEDAASLVEAGALTLPDGEEDDDADADDLASNTVAELLGLAEAEGVEVPEKAKKRDIIDAIEAKRAAALEPDVEGEGEEDEADESQE